MGIIKLPDPVKAVFGVLYHDPEVFEQARRRLEIHFSPVDILSEKFAFVETTYYEAEMGPNLTRRYLSLQNLIFPDQLIDLKHLTNLWEEQWAKEGKRTLNLDPGYLSASNLVLASSKNFSHRIYLGRGIYAEVTMQYMHSAFEKLPWTYPDYFHHQEVFLEMRARYKQQLKDWREPQSNEE